MPEPVTHRSALRIYHALLLATGVCLAPFAAVALAVRRDWRSGLFERLGHVPPTAPGRPAIWVHGASVGEITALVPVVRMLRAEFPDHRLVLSTVTPGGRAAARTRVPEADAIVLFPLDLPWVAARAIAAIAPRAVLFSETELWPSFLDALAARGIPAVMLSGRVSERAFRRYRRWRALFAPVLASVRFFCVQTLETARHLVALGAPPGRVVVTGSLKTAGPFAPPAGTLTLAALGVAGVPVLVAGSTHAGEEEMILDAWASLAVRAPHARLVLAPRRPERFADVAALLQRRGLGFVRRSATPGAGEPWPVGTPVLLLDTLGELSGLYGGARAAFVGGTLVPVGGHNLLEPAAQGTPVVFGPYVANTSAAAERLAASGGGFQVRDGAALADTLARLFDDVVVARTAGERARAAVAASEGALAVTLAVVRGVLGAVSAPTTRAVESMHAAEQR